MAAYSQKHRHYHTVQHIALWFHDAVYDPYASNNEERSADWACAVLTRHGVEVTRVGRARGHIMATCHNAPATDPDSQLVVDIDLSTLGTDEATYSQFETQVRKEYRWVPRPLFRRKRAEILQSFLERPQIYHTTVFHERYEIRARRNLEGAIVALRGR